MPETAWKNQCGEFLAPCRALKSSNSNASVNETIYEQSGMSAWKLYNTEFGTRF